MALAGGTDKVVRYPIMAKDNLSEVVNVPETVHAFGRDYKIQRFTMGPLVRALPHIAPLGYLLQSAAKADIVNTLVTAMSIGGEPALGLISVAISEPVEWLEDKDPVEGLELLTTIIEKNASYFFDSANVERMKAAFARIEAVIQTHGGDASTTSSAPDTAPSATS